MSAPAAATPIYVNNAYLPYFAFEGRYVFMRGGAGSGKSVAWAQKHVIKVTTRPGRRVLVIRKVGATLRQSVFEQLKKVITDWGLMDQFTVNQTALRFRNEVTGSEILCAGIDDPEKLKSITGITDIVVEEATELTEDDFGQLDLRARDVEDVQLTTAFNPIDEGHWLKKRLENQQGRPDTLVLLTTFRDNRFLPASYVATLLHMAATNPNYHRIYVLNEWGRQETGNEFYPMFDRTQHAATPVPYLPGQPIFQSWDANSLPYNAMLCCQPDDQRARGGLLTLRFFREYAIRPPNASIKATGLQFLFDRLRYGWASSAVRLTGDASLRNNKTGEQRGESNFNDVLAALMNRRTVDGTAVPGCLDGDSARLWPKKNPGVNRRRDFLNYVLAGGLHDVRVLIDAGLVHVIEDLELTQKGIDGKLKEKYHDPALNVTYEKRGHFSDCLDYVVITLLHAQYEAFTPKHS